MWLTFNIIFSGLLNLEETLYKCILKINSIPTYLDELLNSSFSIRLQTTVNSNLQYNQEIVDEVSTSVHT